MVMHLSREACAKVQVQGQGGHVLLGVARAWATEVGRSQTFLPGTLASRKQGQWRSFRHGFCTAVLLGDHSGGRLVDKRQHGRPYAGATVRQLVDPHPGETERDREREMMRFCCAAQGKGFAWRQLFSFPQRSEHPRACPLPPGSGRGRRWRSRTSGPQRWLHPHSRPEAVPRSEPACPAPAQAPLATLALLRPRGRPAGRSPRSTCHTPGALAVFCWGSTRFLSSFFKGRRSRNNRKPRSHSKPAEVWPAVRWWGQSLGPSLRGRGTAFS